MSRTIDIGNGRTVPYSGISFEFARSSGPGGQNVNKVSTKVDLLFDVASSPSLTAEEKARLVSRLGSRIDSRGVLRVSAQDSRSQWRNREDAVEKFSAILKKALAIPKKRTPTRATTASRTRRLESKRRRSDVKKYRGRTGPE